LFEEDWIGELSPRESHLIKTYMDHPIKKCPTSNRSDLDRAVGRQVRMHAQYDVAKSWLVRQPPQFINSHYDGPILREFFRAKGMQGGSGKIRRLGRPAVARLQAQKAILADLKAKKLTVPELKGLRKKELTRWGANQNTVDEARKAVLASLRT
jgi:hypothetical protein